MGTNKSRDLPLDLNNNPGGARWCADHGRLECTKNRRRERGECHGPAIRGTDSCKIHGGYTRPVLLARGEARINAWSAIGKAADGEGVDSSAAVLGMLQQSWMRAHLYSRLLHDQVVKDGTDEVELEDGRSGDVSGLIGFRFGAAGKDGHIYAVSEEARALVALESAERDRVVKYAKVAHDMGISERMISMAEKWGDVVVNRIVLIIDGLNLTPDQQALVPALVQAHLGSIELGSGQ
jgi:hypothetical protein